MNKKNAEELFPLFFTTVPIYKAAIASGHADHDTSSVYAVLEQMIEDNS